MSAEQRHTEPKPHRSRAWIPCGCIAFALFSLMLTPVITFVAWNHGNAREVDRRLAKIREAGQPTNNIELDQFYRLPEGATDTTQLWLDGMQPLTTKEYEQAAKDIPIVGAGGEIPRPGEPWPELPRAEALLREYAESLEMFHKAAAEGGAARFPMDFSQGFQMRIEHAQNLRGAARLLKLEAHVRAHRGDPRGCAASIQTIFGARRSLENEPILVCNLVCVAIHGIATNTLAETITTVDFTDEELQSFQRELRSVNHRAAIKRAIIGERVFGCDAFHNPAQVRELVGSSIPIPMLKSDLSLYLEIFDDYLVSMEKDFPESRNAYTVVERKIRKAAGQPIGKLGHIFTLLMTPAMGSAIDATGRSTADGRSADAAIAVELFRRKHGRLPQTLAELVPDFLQQVPQDPFDGQPLRFAVRSDGFVIYSIGRDGKDDGGKLGDPRLDDVMFVPMHRPNP